jgi:hypothetical protein
MLCWGGGGGSHLGVFLSLHTHSQTPLLPSVLSPSLVLDLIQFILFTFIQLHTLFIPYTMNAYHISNNDVYFCTVFAQSA